MLFIKRPYLNLLIILPFIILMVLSSCRKEQDYPDIDNDIIPIDQIIDTLTGIGHEESNDYVWDQESVILISLNGSSISANSPNVTIDGNKAVIHAEGNYKLSGNLNNGYIIVDASKEELIRIILENVSIHNPAGPAILVENARKVIINLPQNSLNQLSDGPFYAEPDSDPNATLFSKADLTLFGEGSLTIDGDFKDGITGKDGVIIKSGIYTVHAVDDGIRGKNYLIIHEADISVNTGGDGLKSDEQSNPKPGNIVLKNTKISAVSNGDGISAEGSIGIDKGYINITAGGGNETDTSFLSQKGIKAGNGLFLSPDSIYIDAADHAIDSDEMAEVLSGVFNLYSARAGIHTNQKIRVSGGDVNIIRSVEGFESHEMDISGGNIRINSIDDCFSATAGFDVDSDDESLIEISDGYMVLDCMNGDGIDSNGDFEITGGTIIIHGPHSAPEVAVDVNAQFDINGGYLIGSGTNSELIDFPDTASLQNSLMALFADNYPQETIFHIKDDENESVVTFKPANQFQSILFSSSDLVNGKTYKIYIEGSVDDPGRDGLSEGTYSPGLFITEFTINEKITVLTNLKSDPGIE